MGTHVMMGQYTLLARYHCQDSILIVTRAALVLGSILVVMVRIAHFTLLVV